MEQSIVTTKASVFDINLGNRTIQARKWKAKDRREFKKLFSESENTDYNQMMNILIRGCISDSDTALSADEMEYVFIKIREQSISDEFDFEYTCKCGNTNKHNLKISDVTNFTFSEYKNIKVGDLEFEMGDVANSVIYNQKMQDKQYEDIIELVDFAFHVKTINKSVDFTLDSLIEKLDDMDTDKLDIILDEYDKQRFMLNREKEFECTAEKCKIKQRFEFDEIPGFFPESWLSR